VVDALIALGSNVGDSLANLREAMALLGEHFSHIKASDIYETAPMYVVDQPTFLNAAVLGKTNMSPMALLELLKDLERQIGRERREQNGPREIDLDLIAYGCLTYCYIEGKELRLRVPHPRVAARRFVLQPAADVAPDFLLPGIGIIRTLLDQTEHQRESVMKLEHALLPVQRLE
jgi:2-amino-4-hydroxy-6-hydroxymethyldihydropteridine diphosphokinase